MAEGPIRRRRPALSCIGCRRRKVRCDRSNPCAHCVAAHIECTYKVFRNPPTSRRQSQRSVDVESPSAIRLSPSVSGQSLSATFSREEPTNHISEPAHQFSVSSSEVTVSVPTPDIIPAPIIVAASNTAVPAVSEPTLVSWLSATRPLNLPQSNQNNRAEGSSEESELHLGVQLPTPQELEALSRSSPINGLFETGQRILERQVGLQPSHIILNKTRILGWNHWMGMAKEFTPLITCYSKAMSQDISGFGDVESQALVTEIGTLFHKCKAVAKFLKLGRPSRQLSHAGYDFTPPSREMANTFAASYFEFFESTHRVLHAPTFWLQYKRFWERPESAPSGLRLQIFLVIAIGSSLHHVEEGEEVDIRNKSRQWIYAAQMWLSGPLEKDRLSMSGLQIRCLVILARQIFSVGGDLVWTSIGSLLHGAMQIGLHRDPKFLPAMSVLDAEMRRRLWATILEFTVQASLDSALPSRISFDDFDAEPPGNFNDCDLDGSDTIVQPHPRDVYTESSLQLLLFNSLPIRLRCIRLLNSLQSSLPYFKVLALSSELTSISQSQNTFLSSHHPKIPPFHLNMLDYLTQRFLLPLHSPFASLARTNPLYQHSAKLSLDTALSLIFPLPDTYFSRLMLIGGGLFREGIRCATGVIAQELLAEVEMQCLNGTAQRRSPYTDMLKGVVKDIIALSVERIKQGETNIKSHTFLSMVLAQVEAMAEGTSYEIAMVKSAKRSLEMCFGMLQTLAGPVDGLLYEGTPIATAELGEQDFFGYGWDSDFDFFLDGAGGM